MRLPQTDHTPDTDERAAIARAAAYAKQRQALERRVRAAAKVRDWNLLSQLAIQMRELDAAVLG